MTPTNHPGPVQMLEAAPVERTDWVLVPAQPTDEMLEAAHQSDREYTLRTFGDVMTVMQGPYDHYRAMLAARPSAPTVALTDSATVELAWLEGWLQFADECVGVECCGHGVGGECCGNPEPVTRKPSEVIEAMAQRHRVLTAMLGEKGKEGGA